MGRNRPNTAPGIQNRSREELLAVSSSARSARYLAIQWRSRATQLNLSKSMSNVVKDSAPSPMRVSDGSDESDSDGESSQSDVSCGTMDESIMSQVSDAQKVVEKWQQRWYERTETTSFDTTASRDEEDERDRMRHESPSASAETLKRSGSRSGSRSRSDLEGDEFDFARKSPQRGRKLITTENDQVEILSALKPSTPLQPVDSGKEFYSDSQHRIKTFMDSDSEDEETPTVVRKGVLIMAEGGKVMETVSEDPITRSQELDYEQNAPSVGNNDDNLSHSACSNNNDDDHLSESSATHQTLTPIINEKDTKQVSFENSTKSIVQTFCHVPEPLKQQEEEEQESFSDVSTINTKESSVVTYTGSVQERIEAVKKARLAAATTTTKTTANDKERKTSSSPTTSISTSSSSHKRTRRTGTAAKKSAESQPKQQPIKWQEHNIVFTFGLLTSYEDAPPTGLYPSEDDEYLPYKDKLRTKSKLTYEILSNFGNIARRTKSLVNGSMKYMMISKDCSPRAVSVQRDGKWMCKYCLFCETYLNTSEILTFFCFHFPYSMFLAKYKAPTNRPKILRSIVKATVPVYVPKDDPQAQEVATHVVLDLFSVSISKGEFSGLRFEKIQ